MPARALASLAALLSLAVLAPACSAAPPPCALGGAELGADLGSPAFYVAAHACAAAGVEVLPSPLCFPIPRLHEDAGPASVDADLFCRAEAVVLLP